MTLDEWVRDIEIQNAYKHHRTKISYHGYLRTQWWHRVRAHVKKIHGYRCYDCPSTTKIEIHHLQYIRFWHEIQESDHLIPLCSVCHHDLHTRNHRSHSAPILRAPAFIDFEPHMIDALQDYDRQMRQYWHKVLDEEERNGVQIHRS